MNPMGALMGGGVSASSSAKGGDQSSSIELGMNNAFNIGSGTGNTGGAISDYLPYLALAALALGGFVLLKKYL